MCEVIDFDVEELFFYIKYSENYNISTKTLLTFLKSLDLCLDFSLERISRFLCFLSKEPSSYGLSISRFSELILPHTNDYHQNKGLLFRHFKQFGVEVPIHFVIIRFFIQFWQLEIKLFQNFEAGIEQFFKLNPAVFKDFFREIAGKKEKSFDFQKFWMFFLRNDLKLQEREFKLFARLVQTLDEGDSLVLQETFCRIFNSKMLNKINGATITQEKIASTLMDPQIDLLKIRAEKSHYLNDFKKKNFFLQENEAFLSKIRKNSPKSEEMSNKREKNEFMRKCDKYDKFLMKMKKTNTFL